ncbi:MAG: hypothetical protein IJF41_01155, partial [Clostridia bacterium]|nr:hypothetical protein [Clostridia bacterium]
PADKRRLPYWVPKQKHHPSDGVVCFAFYSEGVEAPQKNTAVRCFSGAGKRKLRPSAQYEIQAGSSLRGSVPWQMLQFEIFLLFSKARTASVEILPVKAL